MLFPVLTSGGSTSAADGWAWCWPGPCPALPGPRVDGAGAPPDWPAAAGVEEGAGQRATHFGPRGEPS